MMITASRLKAAHHVYQTPEAGGNLGGVLGAELGIERPEGQRQRAGGQGIEHDRAHGTAIMNGSRAAASW